MHQNLELQLILDTEQIVCKFIPKQQKRQIAAFVKEY